MKTFLRNHKKLAAALTVLLIILAFFAVETISVTLWPRYVDPVMARLVARRDIAVGRYRMLELGLPPPWLPKYEQLLAQRYGIGSQRVAGCIVTPSQLAYVESYNEAVEAALNRKYGRDVFDECYHDALGAWKSASGQAASVTPP